MASVLLDSTLQNGFIQTLVLCLPGECLFICHHPEQYSLRPCDLCRGLAAGIYATNGPDACKYVIADCNANVVVVENQKQLDKILQVSE